MTVEFTDVQFIALTSFVRATVNKEISDYVNGGIPETLYSRDNHEILTEEYQDALIELRIQFCNDD